MSFLISDLIAIENVYRVHELTDGAFLHSFSHMISITTTRAEPLSFRAITDLAFFTLYGRLEKPTSALSGRTLCQLAPQRDDYRIFWGAKSFIARKDRGSARVLTGY